MSQSCQRIVSIAALMCAMSAIAKTPQVESSDPHYTEIGFFDVHVCNWPDRPPFYMALFSTTHFQNIAGVQVYFPNGKPVGELDLQRYRILLRPGKSEKRVFIAQLPLSTEATDGWFRATVTTQDGRKISAKDYVVHTLMPIVHETTPTSGQEMAHPPNELNWTPVTGAAHYQVTLRDEWDERRVIFTSAHVNEAKITLPPGLLRQGGRYTWVIHARDSNGSILLGDFNHGSLSAPQLFTVAP